MPHFILYFKKNPFWSITLNKGSYQLFIFAHKILLKLTLCFWEAEAGCRGWDTLGPEVFVYSCRISWSIASLWCRTPPCFFFQNQNEVIILVESKIDQTIFFPVGQRLPVWVGGGGHKEGVHLQQKNIYFLFHRIMARGYAARCVSCIFKLFKSLEAYLNVENHSYFKSCRHRKYVFCNARRDS